MNNSTKNFTNNNKHDYFSNLKEFKRIYKFKLGQPEGFIKKGPSGKKNIFFFPEWYVYRDCDIEIKEWLRRNTSGTLLVTGYRGVGKSSCVDKALCEIEGCGRDIEMNKLCDPKDCKSCGNPGEVEIETIKINFTTIFTLNSLALIIIKEIAKNLGVEINFEENSQKIFIKEQNTSLMNCFKSDNDGFLKTITKIRKFLIKLTASIETVVNLGGHSASVFGLSVKEGLLATQKNLFNQLTESEIVSSLNEIIQDYVNLNLFYRERDGKGNQKRVVFVFDEIDKLKGFHTEYEKEDGKIREFEELVGKIKFVLSNSNATFIFVAGRETYYRWQMDKSRGNSVYSSVFDFVIEVEPFLGSTKLKESREPEKVKLRNAQEEIKNVVTKYLKTKYEKLNKIDFMERDISKSFIRYLLWKSRGIPRKIIHELEYFLQPDVKEKKDSIHTDNATTKNKHTKEDNINSHILFFDTPRIRKIKFYSGLVKEIYLLIVEREDLDNDGILNIIILAEALFKFHRTGFNYADLKLITVSVDQDFELRNEYYFALAIELLTGWWVETSYGRNTRYVFQPHIKAAIDILATKFQDESVSFNFEQKDFKNIESYYNKRDQMVENQSETQRINPLRIQTGLGKINMLLGNNYRAMEYYLKAVRLGIVEIERKEKSPMTTGSLRVITKLMADCYIEVGHIFEKERRLRESMSFYSSALLIAYKSHECLSKDILFDPRILGSSVKEPLDSYFTIGEESIDALSNIAYVQWKLGCLSSTERLLADALMIAKQQNNPYKIASQNILLGYYYFRTGQIKKALKLLREIIEEYENNTTVSDTLLPNYIINSTHEAISCCVLSQSKGIDELKVSVEELDNIFCRMDLTTDRRHIVEIKLLKLKLSQRILRAEGMITNSSHAEFISTVFSLVRNRSSDYDYSNENLSSIRLYYHLAGMVAWHIFSVITQKFQKNEEALATIENSILNEANELMANCRSFFTSIANKCLDSIIRFSINERENLDDKESSGLYDEPYLSSYLLHRNETFQNGEIQDDNIIRKMINEQSFKFDSLRSLLLFLEQAFLICHRVLHKNIFTASASDPADRLGFFYFWVYEKFNRKVNEGFKSLQFHDFKENISEVYFNFSFSDQDVYKKYIPDHVFPNIVCNTCLGDLYYIRRTNPGGNMNGKNKFKYSYQRKCLQYYANAIFSLANDLENNFTKHPLSLDIFFNETNLIPRLRMHEIAENRYRLRWLASRSNKIESLDLDQPGSVQKYCFNLKKIANKKRSPSTKKSFSRLEDDIQDLRNILEPWRYRENLTT